VGITLPSLQTKHQKCHTRVDLNALEANKSHLSVHKRFNMNTHLLLRNSKQSSWLYCKTVRRFVLHSKSNKVTRIAFFCSIYFKLLKEKHTNCGGTWIPNSILRPNLNVLRFFFQSKKHPTIACNIYLSNYSS